MADLFRLEADTWLSSVTPGCRSCTGLARLSESATSAYILAYLGDGMRPYQPSETEAGQSAPMPVHRDGAKSSGHLLHAVSSALLFLAVLATAFMVQVLILRQIWPVSIGRHIAPLSTSFPGSIVLAIAVGVGTAVLARRQRRSFTSYGIMSAHPVRNLAGGALAGIALLSALVLLLHQLDLVVFRGQVLFGAAAEWKLALRSAAFYAIAAYAEEGLVRGFLQYTLTRALAPWLRRPATAGFRPNDTGIAPAFWVSASLLSTLFALVQQFHTGKGHLVLLNAILFGLLMAFSLWRTGSLWWALGYHAAWDWAQSFLWGVPNGGIRAPDHLFLTEATGSALRSGGPLGPEGSAYTAGALAAGLGILLLLHRSRVYPDLRGNAGTGEAPRTTRPDTPR